SLKEHGSIFGGAEPAGEAELYHVANAVHGFGRAPDSAPGRALRAKLLETGSQQEWSIGWLTATVKARGPTADELGRWPGVRRIIEKWNPIEISPVDRGSCGPSCRTLDAKTAGACGCGSHGLSLAEMRSSVAQIRAKLKATASRVPTRAECDSM